MVNLMPTNQKQVETPDGYILFKKPIELKPQFDGHDVCYEIPELRLYCAGATQEDALSDVSEDVIWLWREYALADDSELTKDAIALKKHLISIVKEANIK